MAEVTATTYSGGAASHVERTSYGYGPDGIRASALHEVDADADGIYETATKAEYLSDPHNPTGYSQVLRETTTVAGQVQKTIVFTIGHDVVSQTTTEYAGGLPAAPETLVLGHDGHGSTRLLADLTGTIATVAGARRDFDYAAYGELLNLDAGQAATSLLYSGEWFDTRIGWQNLRGRWYDPATGRFNRLDPFFGNLQDPRNLHKYLYTHGDSVNGIDPTGRMSVMSITIGSAIMGGLAGVGHGAILGVREGWKGAIRREAMEGAFGLAFGALVGLGVGYGGVGLALGASRLGFFLLPSTSIYLLGAAGGFFGMGKAIHDLAKEQDDYERAAAFFDLTVAAAVFGLSSTDANSTGLCRRGQGIEQDFL